MSPVSFILNSILLGVALAMDAFSVSMANGLTDPKMPRKKACIISGTFAGFQFLMPMIGWICIHSIVSLFTAFQKFIPVIALLLLCFIGGKMLIEGIKTWSDTEIDMKPLKTRELFVQGIATSIDALSVGFTISDFSAGRAVLSSLIIGGVTFFICLIGVSIGKAFGMKLAGKANVLGGLILIGIGIEICFF